MSPSGHAERYFSLVEDKIVEPSHQATFTILSHRRGYFFGSYWIMLHPLKMLVFSLPVQLLGFMQLPYWMGSPYCLCSYFLFFDFFDRRVKRRDIILGGRFVPSSNKTNWKSLQFHTPLLEIRVTSNQTDEGRGKKAENQEWEEPKGRKRSVASLYHRPCLLRRYAWSTILDY